MKPSLHILRMPEETAAIVRRMHPEIKKKIKAGLKAIMEEPFAGKMLRDELAGLRSYRISRFRIIYRVAKHEVVIVAVGPRIRIYEETYKLLQEGN
jgi:mRNA interferase RelE/StbE